MTKRKAISKKDRFEMLKRDSFTCQYCGATPPHVVLEPDHIQPVAEGGGNELLNLVTSCFDCNRGKSARLLSDDSVVVKQKNQLDNLQEKREQFKMMYEWRKGLDGLTSEATLMITEYIESKVEPYVITKSGKKELEKTIKKYDFDDILNAVNISASTYLCYGDDDSLEKDSAYNFFSKITGILVNLSRSPLELKVAHIKSIGRRQFGSWNPQQGAIVLSKILKSMRSKGASDESILTVLNDTIEPMTQEAKTLPQWNLKIEEFLGTLDDLTTDIVVSDSTEHLQGSDQEPHLALMQCVDFLIDSIDRATPALIYTGRKLTVESNLTYSSVCTWVLNYLKSLIEYDRKGDSAGTEAPSMVSYDGHINVVLSKVESGWEHAYYSVHRLFWIEIEESLFIAGEDEDLEKDDFQFMVTYFQSNIDLPSSTLLPDTNSVLHSKTNTVALDDNVDVDEVFLNGVVNGVLSEIDRLVPALVNIGQHLDGIERFGIQKAIYIGVVNYWLACWVKLGSGHKPSLKAEFRDLGLFLFAPDNDLKRGLLIAYQTLLNELIVFLDSPLEDSVQNTSEGYTFIIDQLTTKAYIKLIELHNKQEKSEFIESEMEKPEEDSNIIPFPSKD